MCICVCSLYNSFKIFCIFDIFLIKILGKMQINKWNSFTEVLLKVTISIGLGGILDSGIKTSKN